MADRCSKGVIIPLAPWAQQEDGHERAWAEWLLQTAGVMMVLLWILPQADFAGSCGTDKPEIETVVSNSMPAQPFKSADAPVRLKLKAAKTSQGGWGTYRQDCPGLAVEPPSSPVATSGASEDVILVPYGSTEIRITLFPWAKK